MNVLYSGAVNSAKQFLEIKCLNIFFEIASGRAGAFILNQFKQNQNLHSLRKSDSFVRFSWIVFKVLNF